MKRIIQLFTAFAMIASAPALIHAQGANEARAQQQISAALPAGVTLADATLEQIEAAVQSLSETLTADDFAELSGHIAAALAAAQPANAAEIAGIIVRRAPAARRGSVAIAVAANAAVAVQGQPGASPASAIIRSAATASAGAVPLQTLAQAVVNSVPQSAAEVSQALNVQVTAPSAPVSPPSGTAPVPSEVPAAPVPVPVPTL